jgi:peptide/nickel transport system substrate-binding protein
MINNLFPATESRPAWIRLALGRRLLWTATLLSAASVLSLAPAYAADKDTLVIASGADAVTLDPGVSFDGQSVLLWRGVYEALLKYKGGTTEIVPNLAESYSISPDKLTYTFKIRKGIKFQDGETLDAAAVKFNIDRQIAIKQGIAYALGPITKIETPDDSTVVLHLSAPSDGLLSAFAGLYTVEMISPKAIKDHTTNNDWGQAWLRDHMVGTGPCMLQNYTQSQQAVFTRNANYWRGWDGDHFQRVIVKYVHEPSTEQLLLQQGEIDVALFLPDDVVESLDGKPGITVTNVPSFNLYYIVLPTNKGPTANVKVRQAIAYGFNYESFVKDMLRGKARQARGPLPSNFISFNPNIPQYDYDPAKAKQLLAEAGYPKGGFTLKYIYESGYWWKRPLGELFQSNMKDLGITVEIQEMSPSAWAATLSNPQTAGEAFGLVWWPTLATPYDYMWSVFDTQAQGSAGYNWGYYSNPKLDKLLDGASAEPDDAKRKEMYGEAQKLLVEESPALYIYEKNYRLPMSDKLKGFVFNGIYIETIDFYAVHKE